MAIPEEHREVFHTLIQPIDGIALMEVILNGVVTSAVVSITKEGTVFHIQPLLAFVTDGMDLRNADGEITVRDE